MSIAQRRMGNVTHTHTHTHTEVETQMSKLHSVYLTSDKASRLSGSVTHHVRLAFTETPLKPQREE